MRIRTILLAIVCLTLLAGAALPGVAAAEETFNASIARVAGPSGRGMPTSLIMTVQEWSTPEERQNLLRALQEGGEKGLMEELRKMDKGFLRYPASTGWPINHAWSEETAEGERIVRLITERPILFGEAYRNTRTLDYTFGIVEMKLNAKGKGEGAIIPTAQVQLDETGKIIVESFGQGANRLLGVTSSSKD